MSRGRHQVARRQSNLTEKLYCYLFIVSVKSIIWFIYLLCRFMVCGQIKYDVRLHKLILQPRMWWTRRTALIIKVLVFFLDWIYALSVITTFSILLFGQLSEESNIFATILLGLSVMLVFQNNVYLLKHLHQINPNRVYVQVINEVIKVHSLMCAAFGPGTLHERRQLLEFFRLHSRINRGHRLIAQLWLPIASMLFGRVFSMVQSIAMVMYYVLCQKHLPWSEKWELLLNLYLGICLAPMIKILLIGLFNQRFTDLQWQIQHYLNRIDLWHQRLATTRILSDNFTRSIELKIMSFDLELRTHPIRNHILSVHEVCDCKFLIMFISCVIINAMSTVQHGLATTHSEREFKNMLNPNTLVAHFGSFIDILDKHDILPNL
ncbi:gustatory receptor-like 36a [Drosophila tropicalis]|uniref:gustatory receptor-like 36a n=1 Tax=Drosophila tropicalis TaxID=46794 RepID=UPI0035AC01A8